VAKSPHPLPLSPKGSGELQGRSGTEMRRKWSGMSEMVQIMGRPKQVVIVYLKE